MEQAATASGAPAGGLRVAGFFPRTIGHDPALLDQSYRLRYQVYCVERQYLNAGDYPDQRESDEFDRDSVHVGAVDVHGALAATARVIKPNERGFPMFRHCEFFPEVRMLNQPGVVPVEASRVSISRHYARRRRHSEPFLTLVKAVMQAAKRAGATHLIGAVDVAFQRWLVHYGLPFRIAGPEMDYYGPVVPCLMCLHELDEVILEGRHPSLAGFPVGWDPSLWPGQGGYGVNPPASVAGAAGAGWQPYHP